MRNIRFIVLVTVGLATLSACSAKSSARAPADRLDFSVATSRSERVSNLIYDLQIDLTSDKASFSGLATLSFDLTDDSSDLTIDFGGGLVHDVTVNGSTLRDAYNGFFLTIPAGTLVDGRNSVSVEYSHDFSSNGTGLHRFVDRTDGETYLYSYMWPYYANKVFPSFDQPSLKAQYVLTVHAPEDWTVVSASSGSPDSPRDGKRTWRFDATPRISSYVFSLHAGPYHVWEDQSAAIPSRLMARKSISEHVNAEEWFKITRDGFEYYFAYFDVAYPFTKYDQLIVPEFNIGAMENVGAVTFAERFIQHGQSTAHEFEDRAITILHEMAHMWFGNLVTHDWWNGMWLNESFATQMAAYAVAEVSGISDVWHGFFVANKQAAYVRDGQVTTHPIEMPIASSDDFFKVFDAITYQKGASALRQLEHFVGSDSYRSGISTYLKEHSYSTTELDDFIDHQTAASQIDLEDWAEAWLFQSGYDVLSVRKECDGQRLKSIEILQDSADAVPQPRQHRVDIALYTRSRDKTPSIPTVVPATLLGSSTTVGVATDQPCPVIVNPNHNDWTYARIELDASAIEFLLPSLARIGDPLARSMFLRSMYDAAMNGRLPLARYVEMSIDLVRYERNQRVRSQLLHSIRSSMDMIYRLRPETNLALADLVPELEALATDMLKVASGSDETQVWFNFLIDILSSPEGLRFAEDLLQGKISIGELALSNANRWRILILLSRNMVDGVEDLIQTELESNESDFATKQMLTARAGRPNVAEKIAWLEELAHPAKLSSFADQRAVIVGLFPAEQTQLKSELFAAVLAPLEAHGMKGDPYFLAILAGQLLKPVCTEDGSTTLAGAISTLAMNSTALRFTREALQANQNCSALRQHQ